jgi:putative nucleotidyltransferase with HDIG domain
MFGFIWKKDYIHPFIIWTLLLLWYLIFADKFFSAPQSKLDNFVTEQSFWFFNQPPKQIENITIVAIDEASRRHLNLKWPWKRSITARLIRDIASYSPEVIGLDIVFSGKSEEEEDKALISALRSHPKVVLSYVLHRNFEEKPAKGFIKATSSMGFLNKPLEGGVVDKARTFYAYDEKQVAFSLEVEILLSYLGLDKAQLRIDGQGIFLNDELLVPSQKGILPLNYLVHPSKFKIIPASSVLEKKVNPVDLKDKIVLVGATDPLIHDQYPTPLGVWPGVTIVANSLVMLLSKRFVHGASAGQNFLFLLFLGLPIIFINRRSNFLSNTLMTIFILVLTYFSFLYLRARDMHFSYMLILFSATTAYIVPNLYKYLNLLYLSNRLKNLAIIDPLTGFYSLRFFLLLLDEKLKRRQDLVFVGLRIGNYKRLTLGLSFERIKLLTRIFGEHVQSQVKNHFKTSIFSRLSNDTLGVVIEDARKEEIEGFFRAFFEKTKGIGWQLDEERTIISLQGCLIHKSKSKTGRSDNLLYQMEDSFRKIQEDQMLVGELEELVGGEGKARSNDILDFIAYDWEERNKDLEKGLREILEANKRLDRLNWGTLTALARAIDAKSDWTAGHSERVTKLALNIGRILGLTQEELDNLHRAGLLHDIGKIGTPAELIDKSERLTAEEQQIVNEHPSIGERILEPIEAYADIIPIVRQHHEWFNGKGYPDGLSGEAINLGARILAVADVYDALSSERPYRAAMDPDQALQIIKENSGSHFDPVVVDAFFDFIEQDRKAKEALALKVRPFPKQTSRTAKAQVIEGRSSITQ